MLKSTIVCHVPEGKRCAVTQVSSSQRDQSLAETVKAPSLEFATEDVVLASFLRCRNFDLLNLRRSDDETTFFVFHDSQALRVAIVDFANDGVVPVRSFYSTVRDFEAIRRHNERQPL